MIIAVDFDGTIVKHAYPDIGEPVKKAVYWMKKWQEAGAYLILWTMRDNDTRKERMYLNEAIDYCREKGIKFTSHNCNETQHAWTSSPKCYANLYIDDAAFGCPLVHPKEGRPYANWEIIGPAVLKQIQEFEK